MPDETSTLAAALMIALVLYAVTAGADFGGGVWDLLASGPRAGRQRVLIARALAPIWEANHVWLILVIVMLFVAFPRAFAALCIALHIPLTLMLVGIVLRGSAFTFRMYDPEAARLASPGARPSPRTRRMSRIFAIGSVLTPVMLGVCVGAVAAGQVVTPDGRAGNFLNSWLGSFPLFLGLFALAQFAFLAATYLCNEAPEIELQEDFRVRALAAALVTGLLAWVCQGLAREQAPLVFEALHRSVWATSIQVLTGAVALGAMLALALRRYALARALAVLQVTCVLWGWGLAQFPYLLPPALTFQQAAAPVAVLRLMLAALGVGALLLLPSFLYLYETFKAHRIALAMPTPEDPAGLEHHEAQEGEPESV